MKNSIILFSLFSILFCSCEEQVLEQEMPEAINSENNPNLVPTDHELYSVKSFDELNNLFKSLSAEDSKTYSNTLKNQMLTGLFAQGLLDKVSKEEKVYYAEAMVEMRHIMPNFSNFCDLMKDLTENKIIKDEESKKLAQSFYDKNLKVIQSIDWKHLDIKKEKFELMNKFESEYHLD